MVFGNSMSPAVEEDNHHIKEEMGAGTPVEVELT